jgi:hypothetical protein
VLRLSSLTTLYLLPLSLVELSAFPELVSCCAENTGISQDFTTYGFVSFTSSSLLESVVREALGATCASDLLVLPTAGALASCIMFPRVLGN